MNKRAGLAGLIVYLLTVPTFAVPAVAEECSGLKNGNLRVVMEPAQPSYRVGQLASVFAYVTRSLPTGGEVPVEGAEVFVRLFQEDRAGVAGKAITDIDGTAVLRIRLRPNWVLTGLADGYGVARVQYTDNDFPCVRYSHEDSVERPDFILIRR